MTKILIKRLSKQVSLPKYETSGSSGMDLAANIDTNISIDPGNSAIIPTGLALSIPKGFEVQIRPRSGLAAKQKISVLNTPGTIDADYRGEIFVTLFCLSTLGSYEIKHGERIAQLVVSKNQPFTWNEVTKLDNTKRGIDGHGSTGKR